MKSKPPKTLSDISKEIGSEQYRKRWVSWTLKRKYLESAVMALEKLSDEPFFKVLVFLTKSQMAEFEIKQLLFRLNMNSQRGHTGLVFRMPKSPSDYDAPMGRLSKELDGYYSPILKNLQENFGKLVKKRNLFAHHLFESGSIEEMNKEASSALPLVNTVLKEINDVSNIIHDNENTDDTS
jgi:hypothetical protein